MGIISNLFGSRKKEYRRGLQDAMNAYESFGNKQEKALNKIREEVRDGNKRMEDMLNAFGEDINEIYDYLTDQEKAALYNLCTPKDVNTLEESEKRVLIAFLYQLISLEEKKQVTDYQKKFISSLQNYVSITNPQMEIDLHTIENIDSLDTQKIFLQVILEFLFLQKEKRISAEQEEFLSFFSLNKRQTDEIERYVIKLFNAVGKEGICEKYGFVVENKIVNDMIFPNNSYKRITMGHWDGKEILWRVIDTVSDSYDELDSFLLLSEYVYPLGEYCTSGYSEHNMFWCESRLRKYLNETFYRKAFSEQEKELIEESNVNNKQGFEGTGAYADLNNIDTQDKLFILSEPQLMDYLYDDDDLLDSSERSRELVATDVNGVVQEWWARYPSPRTKGVTIFRNVGADGTHDTELKEDDTDYMYDNGHVTKSGFVTNKSYSMFCGKKVSDTENIYTRIAMWVTMDLK